MTDVETKYFPGFSGIINYSHSFLLEIYSRRKNTCRLLGRHRFRPSDSEATISIFSYFWVFTVGELLARPTNPPRLSGLETGSVNYWATYSM